MRGRTTTLAWHHDPTLNAPAKYRKACRYKAFVPEPLFGTRLSLSAETAGMAAEAEAAIRALNATARPALAPLARLLLRTESIASSKVEGLHLDVRDLARAEARMETGGKVSPTALEVIANIDAMELAIDEAASVGATHTDHILHIHGKLMERSSTPHIAGKLRTVQNWIGGNDYNPCGADFVPPPPEHVNDLVQDLCAYINDETLPPIVQAALMHAQFETIHPFRGWKRSDGSSPHPRGPSKTRGGTRVRFAHQCGARRSPGPLRPRSGGLSGGSNGCLDRDLCLSGPPLGAACHGLHRGSR
jgi:hypothetical protein